MRKGSAVNKAYSCDTVSEVLQRWAAERPEQEALSFLHNGEVIREMLTYSELDARARRVAHALRAQGCEGERVLLVYPSGIDFVVALFGCLYAGAIAVPVPVPLMAPQRAFERATSIMLDATPAAALSCSAMLEAMPSTGTLQSLRWIDTANLPAADPDEDAFSPGPDRLALLQYTSGTTSKPKGVMLTHTNLIHNQRILADVLGATPEDRAVCWLPLHHDMGLIGAIMQTVCAGGSCVLMTPAAFLQRPMRWLNAIASLRATISMAPSFAYELCVKRAPEHLTGLDLSLWRVALCGGESIRPETMARFASTFAVAGFHESALMPAYGLAEATLLASAETSGGPLQTRNAPQMSDEDVHMQALRPIVNCGGPFQGQRIAIVNAESRARVADSAVGEIWLQGPSVAQGYWNRRAETEETFRATLVNEPEAGRWLRTGDLGFIMEGRLYVTGRCKELIIVRGVNIDPLDIEIAAAACEPRLQSGAGAAFSIEMPDTEAVVLVHEIQRGAIRQLDDTVVETVTRTLNRSFGVALHDLLLLAPGGLPRTTSGKVQRQLCKQLYLAGSFQRLTSSNHSALGGSRVRAEPATQ